jgi:hypothetical protein
MATSDDKVYVQVAVLDPNGVIQNGKIRLNMFSNVLNHGLLILALSPVRTPVHPAVFLANFSLKIAMKYNSMLKIISPWGQKAILK